MANRSVIVVLLAMTIGATAIPSSDPPGELTVNEALQKAIDSERAAQARYAVFAEKANAEGYPGAAGLFRAAAASEKIHERIFRTLLERRKGTPIEATIEAPPAASTRENLAASMELERQERDSGYHELLEVCRKAGDTEAASAFDTTMMAESEHSNLMMTASWNAESLKTPRTYFVCSLCGYTSDVALPRCPSCRKEAKLKPISCCPN